MKTTSDLERQLPQRSSSAKHRKRRRAAFRPFHAPKLWRSPAFELLEERAMLSVAQDLVSQLGAYQTPLNSALSAATSLPLAGNQLKSLPEFNSIFQNSLASIESQTQGIGNGHHQLAIPLQALSKSFAFEMGLNVLFANVHATGSVAAAINPVLNVGFDYQNGTATLDALHTNLDIGFHLTMPGVEATMSLNNVLYTKANDAGTDFLGHMRFDLTAGGALTPHFSGEAHVNMLLSLSFVDPAADVSFNPVFRTTLDLDWKIDSATNQMMAPTIAFKNFGLDVSSFMKGFLGDVVETVQKFTKPIQPFVDIFLTPVPIISAFGSDETIGTLVLKGAGSSKIQQDSFSLMMQIIAAVNSIDLSGDMGTATIPFGDLKLSGDPRTAGAFDFDTSAMSGAIDDIFGSAALQDVQDTLQSLGNYAGGASSAGFKFPLLENPGQVLVGMLTGNVESLFSFTTGRQHFELAPSIGIGIPGVFGIFLSAGILFDANLTMGYDTAGLIALAQDQNHDAAKLLHGFYFDNSIDTSIPPGPNQVVIRQTGLYLQGFMEVQADLVLAHAEGGLYANISVELHSPDGGTHVHLDDIHSSKLFDLHGKVYANAELWLGLSLPVGPDITFFSFNLGYVELVNFDPPAPPAASPPPVIHSNPAEHTTLLDAAKMGGGANRVTVQPFYDLMVTNDGPAYEADGIRVDYSDETHLYIEQKDDYFFNYYNLVTIEGTAPQGATINVIDPFRVFAHEQAVNPYPAQTRPAIMLTGGTGVTYQYSEASDGTHPIVFMSGGYGNNTLIGGTMEFGNFIPASRVAQAHAHFANVSGFDTVGQTQINQQIANAVSSSEVSGIIGSTMYASRGGLMVGGVGHNSFFATGPGVYEMVGGNWINTFNISPSYGGVPATYQIDGGGGASGLVVRVPGDEHVTFENSTVVDKYNPALKALAVVANAGLSATAHGVQTVRIVAAAGSSVELGDTSEVNVQFSIQGAAHLKFGGSNAPDVFAITTEADFVAKKNHYGVETYMPYDAATIYVPAPTGYSFTYAGRYADPVYHVTRTFGNNHKTQTIPFAVSGVDDSSIVLDGRGASDSYAIDVGVGSFLDVTVEDSDEETQNSLAVSFHQSLLAPSKLTLTDSELRFEYYTVGLYLGQLFRRTSNGVPSGNWYYLPDIFLAEARSYWSSSQFYTPTVGFGANVDVELAASAPFQQTIVNRPVAPQSAVIRFDEIYRATNFPVGTPISPYQVFDVDAPHPAIQRFDGLGKTVDVQANAGRLRVQLNSSSAFPGTEVNIHANTGTLTFLDAQRWSGYYDTFNVLGNAGTLNINSNINGTYSVSGYVVGLTHIVNVLANVGVINLFDSLHPSLINYGIDTQVNVGDAGSLANIHGAINLANSNGHYGLKIDDRNNSGIARAWTIEYGATRIGDLTLAYAGVNAPAPYYDQFSTYEAFIKTGSTVAVNSDPPFYIKQINGVGFPTWQLAAPYYLFYQDGNTVDVSLSVYGDPGGSVAYSARNLPPGIALDSATGRLSGTIPVQSFRDLPYDSTVTATAGFTTRSQHIAWYITSGIVITAPISNLQVAREGEPASLGPITTTNVFNRAVSVTATGLPPGLAYDPGTATIGGVVQAGAAQDGPYHVTLHATDGVESAEFEFDWAVTGLTLAFPTLRVDHVGDVVDVPLALTSSSNSPLSYSADGLPGGLAIDPTTGRISGVITPEAASQRTFYGAIHVTQGNDAASAFFRWSVLPAAAVNLITLDNPGTTTGREGQYFFVNFVANSSLNLPLSFTATGLPAGISLLYGESQHYIGGQIEAGAASATPYHVTIVATDGVSSDAVAFDWIVSPDGPVHVEVSQSQYSVVNTAVNLGVNGSASIPGDILTYSAAGLPPGLSIDSDTGWISGVIAPLAALPSTFQVSVRATSPSGSDVTTFLWHVISSYQPNVITMPSPMGSGVIDVMSPPGTQLTASISPSAGVTLPSGATFPFGFVTFVIRGLAPGAAADLTITGLAPTLFTDYYKYGATPAATSDHWYNFLFGQATDADSAAGTGMEVVGDTIVLHLLDGGRGDDDLALNGVIYDIGGPAFVQTIFSPGDYDRNAIVDGFDFLAWQRQLGNAVNPHGSGADGNANGAVDHDDLGIWATHFGESNASVTLATAASPRPTISSSPSARLESSSAMLSGIAAAGLSAATASTNLQQSRSLAFDLIGQRQPALNSAPRTATRIMRTIFAEPAAVPLTSASTALRSNGESLERDIAWRHDHRTENRWTAIDDCFTAWDEDLAGIAAAVQ